ncbi:MAG: translocation/assembly module TamB domain-containing protein [Pseudanabaenaceae cyanobacterium bins.68]|nr:translocation/assembly module TamB domain-containing protein [Pseudanabaenaceae cyanobacterium bins.68]
MVISSAEEQSKLMRPESSPDLQTKPKNAKSVKAYAGKILIAGVTTVLGGTVGTGIYSYYWLNHQLSPWLEAELSKALERPVKLGQVQSFSPGHIQFAESQILPTQDQPNFLVAPRIRVNLDLVSYWQKQQLGLDLVLSRPQIFLRQDLKAGSFLPNIPSRTGGEQSPIDLRTVKIESGQLTLSQGKNLVTIADLEITSNWQITDLQAAKVTAQGKGRVVLPQLVNAENIPDPQALRQAIRQAVPTPGRIQANLAWNLASGAGQVKLAAQNLTAQGLSDFAQPLNLPFSLTQGQLDSQIQLGFVPGQAPAINGDVQLKNARAIAPVLPQAVTQINGKLQFRTGSQNRVSLQGLVADYGKIRTITRGTITSDQGFDLKIAIAAQEINQLLSQLQVQANLPLAGKVQGMAQVQGAIDTPRLKLNLESSQQFQVDRVKFDHIKADILSQDRQTWQVQQVKATPAIGGTILGSGKVHLPSQQVMLSLQVVDLPGTEALAWYQTSLPIALGKINAAVQVFGNLQQPQILTQFAAPQATYPTQGEILIAGQTAKLRNGTVQVNQGEVAIAGDYQLTSGAWQAQLTSAGVGLQNLVPGLGQQSLAGAIALSSPGGFQPQQIRATADLILPQGINGNLTQPTTAQLNWNGKAVLVNHLQIGETTKVAGEISVGFNQNQLPDRVLDLDLAVVAQELAIAQVAAFLPQIKQFKSAGTIGFQGKLTGAPQALRLDGDLQVEDFSLRHLPKTLNLPTTAQGQFNFRGQVSGPIAAPSLAGRVNLTGLEVGNLAFAPLLQGNLAYVHNQGGKLDLGSADQTNRLALNLNSQLLPQDFLVRLNQAQITGNQFSPKQFQIQLTDFPLAAIALPGNLLDGKITSNFQVDLSKSSPIATGEILINQPSYGRIQAEQLRARLSYAQGKILVRQGQINPAAPTGKYNFELDIAPTADQMVQGKLSASGGNLQELLTAMQWFQLSDLAQGLKRPNLISAKQIQPLKTIGLGDAPLYRQLEYFAQINARLDQADATNRVFPPLTEFTGSFDGDLSFSASRSRGYNLSFDFSGKNWEYGKFALEQVIAQGSLQDQRLQLQRLKLTSGDRFGELSDAQLNLNLLTGKLSSLDLLIPQTGKVVLNNFPIEALRPFPFFELIPVNLSGNVNGTATIGGNLLNPIVNGEVRVSEPTVNRQPLQSVAGSFNLQGFKLNLNATALAQGDQPLEIAGTYPILGGDINLALQVKDQGLAIINLFSPSVQWLKGKGKAMIKIGGNTRIPKLEGKVRLDEASLAIAGLPTDITNISGDIDFDIDRINTNLVGQFSEGKVSAQGLIAITDPNLQLENPLEIAADTLKLKLKDLYEGDANGKVLVKGSLQNPAIAGQVTLYDGRINLSNPANGNGNGGSKLNLGFDQLQIKLGEKVQLVQAPLLNFLAEGEITLNGNVINPRPSGKISILRGQVNAISTRFRLDRSFDNYAIFSPEQGLNPNLNMRVAGVVPEITRTPTTSSLIDTFNPTNVPVSAPGASRSLRVNATVTGSSQNPDIQLSSSPPRTQAEILTLIGGGLFQQGGGDPTAAIANLAGGTAIAFLQDLVGDVFSLSEFNLTPTTASPVGGRTSSLGFAAEAAIDITRAFSFSVRGVINDPSQPTSYTVRYRVDPSTLVRTTTDLKGNNSASVEFETRF